MDIRRLIPSEQTQAQAFYKQFNYDWHPNENDVLWIAKANNEIIGIVRICEENSYLVLRGMFVEETYRGQGIGSKMLKAMEPDFSGRESYCMPFLHLIRYYDQIGFKHIEPNVAPLFLQERLVEYSKRFDKLIIMRRDKETAS